MPNNSKKSFALRIFLAITILLFPVASYAGGFHIKVQLESLEFEGNDEFKMTFRQISGHPVFESDQSIIMHLRNSAMSKIPNDHYKRSINELIEHLKRGEIFDMGIAFTHQPVAGKENEFHADGILSADGHMHLLKSKEDQN